MDFSDRFDGDQLLKALLAMKRYPQIDHRPDVVSPTDIVIGQLTPGEAQLHAFLLRESDVFSSIKPDVATDEEKRRAEIANGLSGFFWKLIHERFPERAGYFIRISWNGTHFTVLHRKMYDCGCGRGSMCGGVRIGVIDLQTGERRPDTLGILRMFEGVTAWCLG